MPQILPLVPSVASYRVGTELGTDSFVLDVRWNGREGAWYLDLFDEFLVPVRFGVKLALGAPLSFGPGVLIAVDLSDAGRDAGFDDLGERVRVYFFTYAEIAAIEAPIIEASVFRPPLDIGEGPIPVVGVLAATLANAMLSADADVLVKGTLAKTLGNATLSAAGKALVKGTLAKTLGNATLSATGRATRILIMGVEFSMDRAGFVDVPGMEFRVESGKRYLVNGMIACQSDGTSNGYGVGWNGPVSFTKIGFGHALGLTLTTLSVRANRDYNVGSAIASVDVANADMPCWIACVFEASADGYLRMMLRSETDGNFVRVMPYSRLHVWELA